MPTVTQSLKDGIMVSSSAITNAYEEGTWTPALSSSTPGSGPTHTIQVGRYTRIGNRVIFNGRVAISALGTGSGDTKITGLPYTSVGTTNNFHSIYFDFSSVTFSGRNSGFIQPSETQMYITQTASGGVRAYLPFTTGLSTSTDLVVSGHYQIN